MYTKLIIDSVIYILERCVSTVFLSFSSLSFFGENLFNKNNCPSPTLWVVVPAQLCEFKPPLYLFLQLQQLLILAGTLKQSNLEISFYFRLGYCNSAINPVIYGLFSREFRAAFRKILCKFFCKVRINYSVFFLIVQMSVRAKPMKYVVFDQQPQSSSYPLPPPPENLLPPL